MLLGLFLLAAGCALPGLEPPAAPEPGILRVTLGGDPARTLLPEHYEVTSLYYTLTFTATGGPAQTGGLGPETGYLAIGESSGNFTLAIGTWDLAVLGFASPAAAADPANALVSGAGSGIVITASAGTAVSVALTPDETKPLTQSGTGTLAYAIGFPAGVTQATLTVKDAGGSPVTLTGGNPINLREAGAGSHTLSSGVYDLELRLYMPGKAAVQGLTAHIYDNMVTKAEYTFAETDFAEYTVEVITAFVMNDGTINYAGRIDHTARTVTVFVPSIPGLTAAVTHTGLSLVSLPDPPDFTAPVTYTVTLEDGAAIPYTVLVSTNVVSTVADLEILLTGAAGGGSAADPVLIKINVNLADTTNGWAAILNTINSKGKYVFLDFSDCTMSGTEFNLGTADTGERYVTGLVLSDAVESIKAGTYSDRTFRYFANLKTLAASGVETVDDYAFSGTGLTSVSLPAAETIGDGAFQVCHNLTTLSLPKVETIGDWAFYGCTGLTSVSLPAAETIGDWAFYGCSGLTSVSLPAAETIGYVAFAGCSGLTSLSLPAAETIGDQAFEGCTGLTSLILPALKAIWGFSGYTSLTSLTLPAVETIGERAFEGCVGLTSLTLPAAETIGERAFSRCTGLTSLTLPAVKTIGNEAFEGCVGLTSLTLPAAETIGNEAFYNCSDLTSVSLSMATSIGNRAFTGRTSLESVSLPMAISIGDWAFSSCTDLTALSLPKVETIGQAAFSGCVGLTSLTLPAAETIGIWAFEDCVGLTSLTLPAVETIGERAFSDCTSLTSLTLPAAETIGDGAFNNCIGLTSLTLPAGKTIGDGAFGGCRGLTSLTLPAAKTIGDYAFSGCSLTSLSLPAVVAIGNNAFANTGGTPLTVTLGAVAPAVGTVVLGYSPRSVTVLVPSDARGYGSVPRLYSGDNTVNNWGNAFRGNSNITLNIAYTP
jgi:hypothetical protein